MDFTHPLSNPQYIERPVFTRVGKFPAFMPCSTQVRKNKTRTCNTHRHLIAIASVIRNTYLGLLSLTLQWVEALPSWSPWNHTGSRQLVRLVSRPARSEQGELPGAVSSGARIIGAMFNEAEPLRIENGPGRLIRIL